MLKGLRVNVAQPDSEEVEDVKSIRKAMRKNLSLSSANSGIKIESSKILLSLQNRDLKADKDNEVKEGIAILYTMVADGLQSINNTLNQLIQGMNNDRE